jgi:hypothetical protein
MLPNDDDDFRAMAYWAIVLRLPLDQRQMVLNFLENLGARVLYQTTDASPLRVVRCGTPSRFMEATRG